MAYDQNNIFAKIIRKEVEANIIYEDDEVLAFEDISKAAPTHILVIPKGEYVNFVDFSSNASLELVASFFKKLNQIAQKLQIIDDGFRIISNIGNDANQSVEHFHVHILAGKKLGPLISGDKLER